MIWKILNSPFKLPKLRFYVGKVAIGVPYFFPRRWVKATPKLAHEATLEYIESQENYNKNNPDYARKIKSYEEIYNERLTCEYPMPKRIGFDFIGLGWKSKWSDTDYRFEWAPVASFVFFNWQIAVVVDAPEQDHYWTAWLYYTRNTDKTKSKKERVKQCIEGFPMIWKVWEKGGEPKSINYYEKVLKKKYLNL